jgi:hypothetical protein
MTFLPNQFASLGSVSSGHYAPALEIVQLHPLDRRTLRPQDDMLSLYGRPDQIRHPPFPNCSTL